MKQQHLRLVTAGETQYLLDHDGLNGSGDPLNPVRVRYVRYIYSEDCDVCGDVIQWGVWTRATRSGGRPRTRRRFFLCCRCTFKRVLGELAVKRKLTKQEEIEAWMARHGSRIPTAAEQPPMSADKIK